MTKTDSAKSLGWSLSEGIDVGARVASLDDGEECGDEVLVCETDSSLLLCVIDGLGHGPTAALPARAAASCVRQHRALSISELLGKCQIALESTRGAAIGFAAVSLTTSEMTFAGIGNIRAMIIGEDIHRFLSTPGNVGAHDNPSSRLQSAQIHEDDLVVIWSDGLKEADVADLARNRRSASASELADMLFERFERARDDAAMLVFRNSASRADRK